MTAPATRMARQATQPPLGAIATSKVELGDANAAVSPQRLVAAIQDLRDRATRERATGSDAVAAYMLGRGSRWLKAWLAKVAGQGAEVEGEDEDDDDELEPCEGCGGKEECEPGCRVALEARRTFEEFFSETRGI